MEGGAFPSGHATRYMHELALGRDGYAKLDATNRGHLEVKHTPSSPIHSDASL